MSSINFGTSLSLVWDKARKINGTPVPVSIPALKIDGTIIAYTDDVANKLAQFMAEISGASSFPRFLHLMSWIWTTPTLIWRQSLCRIPIYSTILTKGSRLCPQSLPLDCPRKLQYSLPDDIASTRELLALFNRIFREGLCLQIGKKHYLRHTQTR